MNDTGRRGPAREGGQRMVMREEVKLRLNAGGLAIGRSGTVDMPAPESINYRQNVISVMSGVLMPCYDIHLQYQRLSIIPPIHFEHIEIYDASLTVQHRHELNMNTAWFRVFRIFSLPSLCGLTQEIVENWNWPWYYGQFMGMGICCYKCWRFFLPFGFLNTHFSDLRPSEQSSHFIRQKKGDARLLFTEVSTCGSIIQLFSVFHTLRCECVTNDSHGQSAVPQGGSNSSVPPKRGQLGEDRQATVYTSRGLDWLSAIHRWASRFMFFPYFFVLQLRLRQMEVFVTNKSGRNRRTSAAISPTHIIVDISFTPSPAQPISTVTIRTALTGTASYLDTLVLAPGLHQQQSADEVNHGELPTTGAMATGYVFHVGNPATVRYLQTIGPTDHLVTARTITVLVLLGTIEDWWGFGVLWMLVLARLIDVVVIERRSHMRWKGAHEIGQGDLLVLLREPKKYERRLDMADDLFEETGKKDWAIGMGIVKADYWKHGSRSDQTGSSDMTIYLPTEPRNVA
ncbi:hypothetical protein IW262DRAFT_1298263 [Armillaria fumosa]|nr:hypothetical protein IW262DRAFT_1298263 [Armillaria fumosa]